MKQNGYSNLNSCLLPASKEQKVEVAEDALQQEMKNAGIPTTACNDGTCIIPGTITKALSSLNPGIVS